MGNKRQKIRNQSAYASENRSEASCSPREGMITPVAISTTENPAIPDPLLEEVLEKRNLQLALKRVCGNKGSAGVDDMPVEELPAYLKLHWLAIKAQLQSASYQPKPVKRVLIPKPGKGQRQLGIPTALDRFIQQALLQVLQRYWDASFSHYSYGFRPGRSAHQAILQTQHYIAQGNKIVVDIDLERFFDHAS